MSGAPHSFFGNDLVYEKRDTERSAMSHTYPPFYQHPRNMFGEEIDTETSALSKNFNFQTGAFQNTGGTNRFTDDLFDSSAADSFSLLDTNAQLFQGDFLTLTQQNFLSNSLENSTNTSSTALSDAVFNSTSDGSTRNSSDTILAANRISNLSLKSAERSFSAVGERPFVAVRERPLPTDRSFVAGGERPLVSVGERSLVAVSERALVAVAADRSLVAGSDRSHALPVAASFGKNFPVQKSALPFAFGGTTAFPPVAQLCSNTLQHVSKDIADLAKERGAIIRQLPQPRIHGTSNTALSIESTAPQRRFLATADATAIQSAIVKETTGNDNSQRKRKKPEEEKPDSKKKPFLAVDTKPLVKLDSDFIRRRAAFHHDNIGDAQQLDVSLTSDLSTIRTVIYDAAGAIAKKDESKIAGLFYKALCKLSHSLTFQYIAILFGKWLSFDEPVLHDAASYSAEISQNDFCTQNATRLLSLLASTIGLQLRITAITSSIKSDKRGSRSSTVSDVELQLVEPELLKKITASDRNGVAFCERLNWIAMCLTVPTVIHGITDGLIDLLSLAFFSKNTFRAVYDHLITSDNQRLLLDKLVQIAQRGAIPSLVYFVNNCLEITQSTTIDALIDRVFTISTELLVIQTRYMNRSHDEGRLLYHLMRNVFLAPDATVVSNQCVKLVSPVSDGEKSHRRFLIELLDLVTSQKRHDVCYNVVFRMLTQVSEAKDWLLSFQSAKKAEEILFSIIHYSLQLERLDWQRLVNILMTDHQTPKVEQINVAIACLTKPIRFIQLPVAVRRVSVNDGENRAVLLFDGVEKDGTIRFLNLLTDPGTINVAKANIVETASKYQVFVRLVHNGELGDAKWCDLATVFDCHRFDSPIFGHVFDAPEKKSLFAQFPHCQHVVDAHVESVARYDDIGQSMNIDSELKQKNAKLSAQQFVRIRHNNINTQPPLESTNQYVHKNFLKHFATLVIQTPGTVETIVEKICLEHGNDFQIDVVNFGVN